MSQKQPKTRRTRGRILTEGGADKLEFALDKEAEKRGSKLSNEDIAEKAKMGVTTVSKIRNREEGADKKYIEALFRAFGLILEPDDLDYPSSPSLSLSPDYLERTAIESRCYAAIEKPGIPIRIQAPWHMGKTWLLGKILSRAKQQGYWVVSLSFGIVDKERLSELDQFLRWFAACIGSELKELGVQLELPKNLEDYWDNTFGSKHSCKKYVAKNLLAKINKPLVLGLDDMDVIYQNPEITQEFFDLLRGWCEEGKRSPNWDKLRLVLAYSRKIHISDIFRSPFNLGEPINSLEFEPEEVEKLAQQYKLDWNDEQIKQLMAMVGGHPYLVQIAFQAISHQNMKLDELLTKAHTTDGIYHEHLENIYGQLQQLPQLKDAMKQVVQTTEPVLLEWEQRLMLEGMGLVKLEENKVTIRCPLYRQYFQNHL
ncbi:MAG: serine/threonine protein kinase [Symploca sp. SIO1B1]|nr:serine/threonine protein kinase [Symploca sp. SIO1B1]